MLDLCIAQDLEHRNGVEMFVQLVLLKRIAVTVLNSNIPRSPRKKKPSRSAHLCCYKSGDNARWCVRGLQDSLL